MGQPGMAGDAKSARSEASRAICEAVTKHALGYALAKGLEESLRK